MLLIELHTAQSESESYALALNDYKTKRVVQRDTIVYNIKFIDSVVYRIDTVVVYDTIRKRIWVKRKNRP